MHWKMDKNQNSQLVSTTDAEDAEEKADICENLIYVEFAFVNLPKKEK